MKFMDEAYRAFFEIFDPPNRPILCGVDLTISMSLTIRLRFWNSWTHFRMKYRSRKRHLIHIIGPVGLLQTRSPGDVVSPSYDGWLRFGAKGIAEYLADDLVGAGYQPGGMRIAISHHIEARIFGGIVTIKGGVRSLKPVGEVHGNCQSAWRKFERVEGVSEETFIKLNLTQDQRFLGNKNRPTHPK